MTLRITRRTLLSGSLLSLAAGCGENPAIVQAFGAVRTAAFGFPDLAIDRATVTNLPYASLTARVGKGPQALLVLSHVQGQDQHWIAPRVAMLVTRAGRLVKTVGFPSDLGGVTAADPDPVDGYLHRLKGDEQHTRLMDLGTDGYYGVPVDSTFATLGPRRIEIVEIEFDTILVREDNRVRIFDWRFENYYWVDPVDGFVWKATQHFARATPPMETQVLKPAAP